MVPSETKGYEPKHKQLTGALFSAMELRQVSFLFAFVCLCVCVFLILHVFKAVCIVSGAIISSPEVRQNGREFFIWIQFDHSNVNENGVPDLLLEDGMISNACFG